MLASRRLAAPSSPPRKNVLGASINSHTMSTMRASQSDSVAGRANADLPSKLNALNLAESDDDSDIEVFGPFPASKTEGKCVRANSVDIGGKASDKPVHPFFVSSAAIKASASRPSVFTKAKPTEVKVKAKAISAPKSTVQAPRSASNATFPVTSSSVTPSATNTRPDGPTRDKPDSTQAGEFDVEGRQAPLPKYSYRDYHHPTPTVVYTRHEEEADDLVLGLKPGPVSLDLEWCFYFTKNKGTTTLNERRVAVVQVTDVCGMVLIIQIFGMRRFPKNLQSLIENPNVPKMGVNILNDGKKLFRDYGILAQSLVELGALAMVADPAAKRRRKMVSLAKLVEQYCGKLLEKGSIRTGNWEAKLDQEQIDYAANDAHSTIQVYNELVKMADEMSINLWDDKQTHTQAVGWHRSTLLASRSKLEVSSKILARPQQLRAYQYWHHQNMSLEKMCMALSLKSKGYGPQIPGEDKNLRPSTVITYILGALQSDSTLPFQIDKVKDLLQMEITSWSRHHDWILDAWEERASNIQ